MDALIEIFSFKGRANRAWYFWHVLLDDVLIFSVVIALVVLGTVVGNPIIVLPLIGAIIAATWAALAITVKRLHDLGRPGWHWFLFGIPLYNMYLGFVLLLRKGTAGPNQYGADPLLRGADPSGYLEG